MTSQGWFGKRPRWTKSLAGGLLGLALLVGIAGCGGTGATQQPPPPPPVSVAISPGTSNVAEGGTLAFTATVTGSSNTAVTWSVQEGAAGGVVTSAGAYTAPQTAGTFHVVATSAADPTRSAVATVTVHSAVSLTVSPATDLLGPGGTATFVAHVTGTSNTAVIWAVVEGPNGGTITPGGFYTAPSAQGTFHVMATSVADSSVNASSAITIVANGFTATASLTTARGGHTSTLLGNGKVLVAGGFADFPGNIALNSTELFDPATSAFSPSGTMSDARGDHTATLLSDGKLLVIGGSGPVHLLASAELYDSGTGMFIPTASMAKPRSAHTATLLKDGRVLVVGGLDEPSSATFGVVATAEIYDPATHAFSATGNMSQARFIHTATLLGDGRVLIAGGFTDLSGFATTTAELFDPATGSFTPARSMSDPRGDAAATLLPNGKVLVLGGFHNDDSIGTSFLFATTEIFDPGSATFSIGPGMTQGRRGHTATPLNNQQVLVAGGIGFFGDNFAAADLFNPVAGTFSATGGLATTRYQHSATRLADGRVLFTGGFDLTQPSRPSLATAELYQ